MTAAEHEAAYKASLAETERLKQQWRDALIAKSPYKLNMLVFVGDDAYDRVVGFEVNEDGSLDLRLRYSGRWSSANHRIRRIDESGNPLPPRVAD